MSFLPALLTLMAIAALGCTRSKEYSDRGAAGGAGAPSEGDGGTGGDGSGGDGGSEASTGAGRGGTGSGGEAGASGHGSGNAGTSASGQCDDGSDGAPCGETICDTAFGECTADDVCALTGELRRSCTERRCEAGECLAVEVIETAPCVRTTDGDECGASDCPEWGACSYGNTCANAGTRARTCTTHTCAAGICQTVTVEQTDSTGCARNTDGYECAATECGSCSFASSCDAQAEKWCTEHRCGGGTCNANGFSSTYGCPNQAVCTPSTTQDCWIWDANACDGAGGYCTGTETCNDSCGWNACVRVVGGCNC